MCTPEGLCCRRAQARPYRPGRGGPAGIRDCAYPAPPCAARKVISNIEEIRARGARTIVIAEEEDHAVDAFAHDVIRVPAAPTLMMPLLSVVPLQVFASALAQAKGYDVDQPRNLAKSVTVE